MSGEKNKIENQMSVDVLLSVNISKAQVSRCHSARLEEKVQMPRSRYYCISLIL